MIADSQNQVLMTVREMAASLRISVRHLQDLTKARLVPCVRLGRCVRYRLADVVRAMDRLTIKPVS